jgi:hypothetical protein
MDNVITTYFRLRKQGLPPSIAWAHACDFDSYNSYYQLKDNHA